jgi:hypothetical protein
MRKEINNQVKLGNLIRLVLQILEIDLMLGIELIPVYNVKFVLFQDIGMSSVFTMIEHPQNY